MTPAEHTSQLDRVRGSLLETHCDVYAPRDRKLGKPDAAIVAHGSALRNETVRDTPAGNPPT